MTVNTSDITSGPYTGNGVTTEFSYDFRVDDETQLIVYETTDTGVETVLTVNTDYTVAGIGDAGGGTITRVSGALPNGYTWYIRSNYQPTQLTAFASQGAFFPSVHESAIDKVTFLIQQLIDRTSRAIRFRDGYSGNADPTLPDPEALNFVRWNAAGTALENSDGTTSSASSVPSDAGYVQTDLDRRVVTFDTVASMVAATFLQIGEKVRTIGYYTAGDGGGNDYEIVAAATGTDDGGSYIDLTGISGQAKGLFVDGTVNVKQFGAVGDGVTDDTSAIQATITSAQGSLYFGGTETYKVTDELTISSPVNIVLNNSTILFDGLANTKRALWIKSDNVSVSGGKIEVDNAASGGHGQHNSCCSVGDYNTGDGYQNIKLENLVLDTDKTDGVALNIIGDCNNVSVTNVDIINAISLSAGFIIHWGGVDTFTNTTGYSPATGSEVTKHPHNISVSNVTIGTMTSSTGTGFTISGAYDVTVDNVICNNSTQYVGLITVGDYGFEFANDANIKIHGMHNISVSNVVGKRAGYPLYLDGYKNVTPATGEKEVVNNIVISSCSFRGNAPTDSAKYGVRLRYIDNVTLDNCVFDNFYRGIQVTLSSTFNTIKDCVIKNSYTRGYTDDNPSSSTPNFYNTITGCLFKDNNTSSTASTPDIYLRYGGDHTISGNKFDSPLTAYSVRSEGGTNSSYRNKILNNTTITIPTTVIYSFGSGSDYELVSLFSGNTVINQSTMPTSGFTGGQKVLPYEATPRAGGAYRVVRKCTGDAIPTGGLWTIGDTIYYQTPTASSFIGAVCVTEGTPGTWKTFGATSA